MISTLEKIKICCKTHMTMGDVVKVLGTSHKTIRPEWNKLCNEVKRDGKIVNHKHGIKSERVLTYFEIDINQLIRLNEYEKKEVNA